MEPLEKQEIQATLSRNASFSFLANIVYLVTRLFIPPFILHYVTLAEYGLWSYCFIFIGYISLSAFGISNVYVRYFAVYAANKETRNINKLATTGLILVGSICLILLPFIWGLLPWFLHLLHVSAELQSTAFNLIFWTIAIFLVDLFFNAFALMLQSLQLFVIERTIWMISFFLETTIIVVLLVFHFGIYALLWAYMARILFSGLLCAVACFKIVPGLSLKLKFFDSSLFNLFFHFGGIVQLTGILSVINRSIEKVFAGLFMGPAATALYDVGEKFPTTALILPGSVINVFLPATAQLHAKEEHETIKQIYLHGTRWVNLLTGLIMGFLASFSLPLITCWLGPDPKYEIAAVILVFFSFAYQMDVMTGAGSAIYRSINRPARELVYSLLQLVFVLAAAVVAFPLFGYTIMVINYTVASMMVLSAFVYIYFCNRYFELPQKTFISQVFFPGVCPYFIGFCIHKLMQPWFLSVMQNRWETFGLLLLGGLVYVMISASLTYYAFCNSHERTAVKNQIKRLIGEMTGKK